MAPILELLQYICLNIQIQLRTFKKKFAEMRKHVATAAKLHSEECAERVTTKEQELQFIKVKMVGGSFLLVV